MAWNDKTFWIYERLDAETGKIKTAPVNDYDGKVTGHIVFGVKEWLDENPGEARRLGWVKHIKHNPEKWMTWNKQTQYLERHVKIIDDYTYEDEYVVKNKTEEMMRRAETGEDIDSWWETDNGVIIWGDV